MSGKTPAGEMPSADQTAYCSVWDFLVSPEHLAEFVAYNGPEGVWVALFRQAIGHLRTELHRDRSNPLRFITIDHWESAQAREDFRKQFAEQFEDIDRRCESFTTQEREIGQFDAVQ